MFGLLSGGGSPFAGSGSGMQPTPQQKQAMEMAYKRFLQQYEIYVTRLLELSTQVKQMAEGFSETLPPGAIAAIKQDPQKLAVFSQAYQAQDAAFKLYKAVQYVKPL